MCVVALGGLAAAGCSESVTAPSGQAPFSQTEVRVGTGAEATTGSVITVHYAGWLYDQGKPGEKGLQFDTSVGGTPFSFILGAGQVISGWDRGVPGMKVGGTRRLVLPPSLAYGNARNGIIPPNATLIFDIELVAVQ
jgi:FKBP-type peptidyl-prolyl cis-trans isomerase FkpA